MEKEIETLFKMPHNQLRKAAHIKECIIRLEELQRRYCPIFDEDPKVNQLLKEMHSEHERVMESLRQEKDVDGLMRAAFKE